MKRRLTLIALSAVFCIGPMHASAAPLVSCTSPPVDGHLICDLRSGGSGVPEGLSAALSGGKKLPTPHFTPLDPASETISTLILIDRSDPARKVAVAKSVAAAEDLLASAPANVSFGVGVFDSGLTLLAEPGAGREAVKSALAGIGAEGLATEIYSSVIGAVERLKSVKADRKTIIIFSDGKAEDRAYSLDDAVSMARSAGVSIYGIGYAERQQDTPSLQVLQRMADETGGLYLSADIATRKIGDGFPVNIVDALFGGGRVDIDLSDVSGKVELELSGKIDGAAFRQTMLVTMPESSIWALIAMAGGGVVVAGAAAAYFMKRRSSATAIKEPTVWLEMLDGAGSRFPLTASAVRIGRNADNDLRLDNNSVSGHHCEIHLRRDGSHWITDLGSTNGTCINEEQVTSGQVRDGDLVEIGEVRMRFVGGNPVNEKKECLETSEITA